MALGVKVKVMAILDLAQIRPDKTFVAERLGFFLVVLCMVSNCDMLEGVEVGAIWISKSNVD